MDDDWFKPIITLYGETFKDDYDLDKEWKRLGDLAKTRKIFISTSTLKKPEPVPVKVLRRKFDFS